MGFLLDMGWVEGMGAVWTAWKDKIRVNGQVKMMDWFGSPRL
jgi:hypothetical protein